VFLHERETVPKRLQTDFVRKSFTLKMPFVVLEKLNKLKVYYRAPTLSHTVRLSIEDAYTVIFGRSKGKEKDDKPTEE